MSENADGNREGKYNESTGGLAIRKEQSEVTIVTDRKQLHAFALKWLRKFGDENSSPEELAGPELGAECAAMGFQTSVGHTFSAVYGQAGWNCMELENVVDGITDIPLLGSAVYARWKHFTPRPGLRRRITEPENRAWFMLALDRLAVLSDENQNIFTGTLQKMRLVTNMLTYGPTPDPDEEVEQHLTINRAGRVWFSAYAFGDGSGALPKTRTFNYSIGKEEAAGLLDLISARFCRGYQQSMITTDVGDWDLELTNTKGQVFRYHGDLSVGAAGQEPDDLDLSQLVRDMTGIPEMAVFGGTETDEISRIAIDYHRLTIFRPPALLNLEGTKDNTVHWDYTEHLIIDRAEKTLEHIQNIASDCKVSRKYEIEGGVESLLDSFDAETFFSHVAGNPDDVVENPDETKDYRITIDYQKGPERVITGTFDRNGLPDDFGEFADRIFDFIHFYGMGEILDPVVYDKAKRRIGEVIYCSVIFGGDEEKTYYYLTDDDSIEIDDYVLVPAGEDNHEAIAQVVAVEYYAKDKVPRPMNQTRHIIRKCTDEDFIEPDSDLLN